MPNWCYNELHVTGLPEQVEEFRVFHAQHIPSPSDTLAASRALAMDSERFPARALVAERHLGDLSFLSACPISFSEDLSVLRATWGTKWDIEGETHELDTVLDRSPQSLPYGQSLTRAHSIGFDTADNPPGSWFEAMAPRFEGLCITLGYKEEGNGDFGFYSYESDEINHDTFDKVDRGLSTARSTARRNVPPKPKQNKLLSAIYADDATSVLKHLPQCDADGLVNGVWTPLMYAAKAGATATFVALLRQGHDPAWTADSGIGIIDILFDVRPDNQVALVEARYAMLEQAFDKNPTLASRPLASGITPAEMAVRFSMVPAIGAVERHDALNAQGEMGGWMTVAVDTASPAALDRIGHLVPEKQRQQFYSAVALRSAKDSNVELLRAVFDRVKDFDPIVHAQLRGDAVLPDSQRRSSDEFIHAYNALLASKAIERVIGAAKATSASSDNKKSLISPA